MSKITPQSIKYAVGILQREFPSLPAQIAVEVAVKIKQVETLEEISESLKTISKNLKDSK